MARGTTMGNRTRPSNEPWHPTVSSCLQQIWSPTRNFHSSIDQRNRSHPSRLHVSDFVVCRRVIVASRASPVPGKGNERRISKVVLKVSFNGSTPRKRNSSFLFANHFFPFANISQVPFLRLERIAFPCFWIFFNSEFLETKDQFLFF